MSKITYVLLVLPLLFSGCSSREQDKPDNVPAQSAPQVNEYPPLVLRFENGEELSTKNLKGKNVFVLFQPDCSHCQEEAIHIEQRLGEFKDYNLYFISSSAMDQIMGFAKDFKLDEKKNVKFAWTNPEGVLTYYGPIPTPSVYIYSNGKMKQSFNGQTEIDTILQAL
ncbi:MAG: redoxin domain-containing protein [Chryseosolibacter sp.]